MSDLINEIRRKGRVEVDEHIIEYGGEWHRLKQNDHYLAKHGDGEPELLTCRRLEVQRRTSGRVSGKVFPKERKKKLYNLEEVIKVVIRVNPNYDPDKKEPVHGPEPEAPDTPNEIESGSTESERSDGAGPPERASQDGVGDVRPVGPAVPGPPRKPRDPQERAGRTDYTAAARDTDASGDR